MEKLTDSDYTFLVSLITIHSIFQNEINLNWDGRLNEETVSKYKQLIEVLEIGFVDGDIEKNLKYPDVNIFNALNYTRGSLANVGDLPSIETIIKLINGDKQ